MTTEIGGLSAEWPLALFLLSDKNPSHWAISPFTDWSRSCVGTWAETHRGGRGALRPGAETTGLSRVWKPSLFISFWGENRPHRVRWLASLTRSMNDASWVNYKKESLRKLKVAYNDALRISLKRLVSYSVTMGSPASRLCWETSCTALNVDLMGH